MQQLSADILVEILSRLHVKDLLRFKSVSKTWNSIISSQYFINLHLKKSISSPSHYRIFIPYSDSIVDDDIQQYVEEELTWPEEATGYFLGISSDGLVCYMDSISVHPTRICVWNPATRVSKTLNIDGMIKFDLLVSWFGRESSDDVYKVVLGIWLSGKEEEEEEEPTNRMQLIALSIDDSHQDQDWKYYSTPEINIDEVMFKFNEDGKLLHGIVHWLVTQISADDHVTVLIFTYNLGQKTVGDLMPTPIKSHKMHHLSGIGVIGVIDGCMSAICGYYKGLSAIFEVWVMKEYGIKESWTKLLNIPHPGGNVRNLELVGVSGYGDIVFRSWTRRDNVLIYNVAENKYTMTFSINRRYIRMHVETLVSPK